MGPLTHTIGVRPSVSRRRRRFRRAGPVDAEAGAPDSGPECIIGCDLNDVAQVCPQGTACFGVAASEAACKEFHLDCRPPCRPPPSRHITQPSLYLQSLLGVPSFGLSPMSSESGHTTYGWQRPTGAVAVVCAVFTCMPRVASVGTQDRRTRGGEARRKPETTHRARIA
jgi:hypothetical protein